MAVISGEIICPGLGKIPDSSNWSEGNIWDEAVRLIKACEWFRYTILSRGAMRTWHSITAHEQTVSKRKSTSVFMKKVLVGNSMQEK